MSRKSEDAGRLERTVCCFNGAETKMSRKCLLAMVGAFAISALQWGRDKNVSEIKYIINMEKVGETGFNGAETKMSRKYADVKRNQAGMSCFNGAETKMSRKYTEDAGRLERTVRCFNGAETKMSRKCHHSI